jgi:hypothetical protein
MQFTFSVAPVGGERLGAFLFYSFVLKGCAFFCQSSRPGCSPCLGSAEFCHKAMEYDIMSVRTKMVFLVLGASRYNFDGISGTKVFTQQDSEGNDNVVGMEVVEYGGDLALFDHFRGLHYPLEMNCEVQVTRGARGKAGLRIVSASPVRSAPQKAVA